MTDFRALCVELADELTKFNAWYIEDNGYGLPDLEARLRRVDAALAESDGPAVPSDREPASVMDQLKHQLLVKAKADLIRQVIDRALRDTASVHWRIGEGPEEGGQMVRVRDLLTWAEQAASDLEKALEAR